MTVALEWHCTHCQHRWPVTFSQITHLRESASSVTPDRESAVLEENARLREENEDLRASAVRWRQLYENALRRYDEREDELAKRPNDINH